MVKTLFVFSDMEFDEADGAETSMRQISCSSSRSSPNLAIRCPVNSKKKFYLFLFTTHIKSIAHFPRHRVLGSSRRQPLQTGDHERKERCHGLGILWPNGANVPRERKVPITLRNHAADLGHSLRSLGSGRLNPTLCGSFLRACFSSHD